MPNIYYDAPYLDEEEHAALDHTGIPGVGGGGSVSLIFDDYVEAERNNAPQTITNGNGGFLKFDTIGFQSGTSLTAPAIDGSDSVWTVEEDGDYLIVCEADWEDNAAGTRRLQVLILPPGGGGIGGNPFGLLGIAPDRKEVPLATNYYPTVIVRLPLQAGSTVGFIVEQTSGGDLDVTWAMAAVTRVL